ncbi:MAG: UvrB/UvrC motif-containing protein [Limnochordaceae bacterium]|nr:UvrB/UvrC motif-containing protein [Limnochordaceae bacterium]
MLCEECHQRPATVHVVRQVNQVREEKWLCEECARQQGEITLDVGLGGLAFSFQNLLSGLFSGAAGGPVSNAPTRPGTSSRTETVCPVCGTSLADFRRTGLLGCAECYEFFDPALQAIYRRVQGSTQHQGKRPASRRALTGETVAASATPRPGTETGAVQRATVSSPQERLLELRAELQDAIRAERYEKAAQLRDQIHTLEAKLAGSTNPKKAQDAQDGQEKTEATGSDVPRTTKTSTPSDGKSGPEAGSSPVANPGTGRS